jgi:aspartate/methionine/tyrosine aminotransferase
VPTPSYPLLDQIGAQAGVRLERYALRYSGGWDLDLASLPTAEELARRRVRAIVVISPNNPTGSRLGEAEFDALAALELPLIVDEVFRPFALDDGAGFDPLRKEAPLFLLDGLSKRAAAPGLKLGWVLAHGPRSFWAEGIERLSTLADALLATNAFAQRALGQILETEHEVSELVRARLLTNLRLVQEAARGTPVSVLSVQAGFHLILQLPQVWSEEEYLEKLSQMGVWAHPGSLYSLPMGPALVISLLPPPSAVQEGMAAVVQLATSACGLSD